MNMRMSKTEQAGTMIKMISILSSNNTTEKLRKP
jgi:hypothetical protein